MRQKVQSPQALLKKDTLEILVLLPKGIVMMIHFKTFFTCIAKINSAWIKNRQADGLTRCSLPFRAASIRLVLSTSGHRHP